MSADSLTGQGYVQFGGVDAGSGQVHPVAVNGFQTATLDKFCQSVFVPNMPVVGDLTLRIEANGKGGMEASNLVVGLTDISGDLTLGNPQIGIDAGSLSKGPAGLKGLPGSFGLQADTVSIEKLRQVAWSTTAGSIKFKGMTLNLRQEKNECF